MQLLWESIKPEENRYRFYSLSVGPDLWGDPCLVSRWGRLWESSSREAFNWPEAEAEVQIIMSSMAIKGAATIIQNTLVYAQLRDQTRDGQARRWLGSERLV